MTTTPGGLAASAVKRRSSSATGARQGLSLISAITSHGHMRSMILKKGSVDAVGNIIINDAVGWLIHNAADVEKKP